MLQRRLKRPLRMLAGAAAKSGKDNSRHCRITTEELAWLEERITVLRTMVQDLCERRLAELRNAAA